MEYWLVVTGGGLQLQGGAAEFAPEGARFLTTEEMAIVSTAQAAGKVVSLVGGEIDISDPPPPAPEVLLAQYTAAIEAHVDAVAGQKGYRDATSCASYVVSTVAAWATDATAFVAWRDAVWQYVLGLFAEVQAGQTAIPDLEDLIAELPVIDWP
jgi:hypothetical protein